MLPGSVRAQLLTGSAEEDSFSHLLYWPEDEAQDQALASRIVQAVMRSKQAVVKSRSSILDSTGKPLDCLGCPLFVDDRLAGIVIVEMTSRSQPMQQAAAQMVQNSAKWLDIMIKQHEQVSRKQLINLIDLVAAALGQNSYRAALTEVVNELARRFSCERVTIGFSRFRKIAVEAVSQSHALEHNSNLARALKDAMGEAVDQAAVIVFPEVTRSNALATTLHQQLAGRIQGGTSICTIPLVNQGRMIGALLLERSADNPFTPETVEQCQQAGLLLGPVLDTRRKTEQSVLRHALSSFRILAQKVFGPGHLTAKLGTALGITLAAWLFLATAPLKISSDSFLEAGVQRAVVAPLDGFIAAANVRAGDIVKAGALMAKLDDRELLQEQRKWLGQRTQLLKEYRKALAGADRAEIAIIKSKRAQAEAQLALVEQQLERTRLSAPVSGLVVSGDLSQGIGSPVERGEVLFEVAPTDDYRVVMKIADRDIGRIAIGQQGQLKLAGIPDQLIDIEVSRLTPISNSDSGENYFRVEALLDRQSDLMRPGMAGVAKIEAGKERLIWIWSRQLVEWLRLQAWNYLP